jgi:hypothetical protein
MITARALGLGRLNSKVDDVMRGGAFVLLQRVSGIHASWWAWRRQLLSRLIPE